MSLLKSQQIMQALVDNHVNAQCTAGYQPVMPASLPRFHNPSGESLSFSAFRSSSETPYQNLYTDNTPMDKIGKPLAMHVMCANRDLLSLAPRRLGLSIKNKSCLLCGARVVSHFPCHFISIRCCCHIFTRRRLRQ